MEYIPIGKRRNNTSNLFKIRYIPLLIIAFANLLADAIGMAVGDYLRCFTNHMASMFTLLQFDRRR